MSTIKLHRAVCALLLLLASATGKAQNLALKTNLLYDAVLIPNIGVEVSLGKQWTASADWFYTWFSSDNRHRYWQGYGGYLTARYCITGTDPLIDDGLTGGGSSSVTTSFTPPIKNSVILWRIGK